MTRHRHRQKSWIWWETLTLMELRKHGTLQTQGAYQIQLNQEAEILHMGKEGGEEGLANLCRSRLYTVAVFGL